MTTTPPRYPTDETLDRLEAEVNRFGTVEQTTETFIMLINTVRSMKDKILAYEEALSLIGYQAAGGGATARALARKVLSKEF